MTKIGLSHYLSVAKTLKNETRAVYERVLGAGVESLRADLDIFTFVDLSRIGIFYIDPNLALTPAQHMSAMWLEFQDDNEATITGGLHKLGMRQFDHFNMEPRYFQAPGGQVFGITEGKHVSPLAKSNSLKRHTLAAAERHEKSTGGSRPLDIWA